MPIRVSGLLISLWEPANSLFIRDKYVTPTGKRLHAGYEQKALKEEELSKLVEYVLLLTDRLHINSKNHTSTTSINSIIFSVGEEDNYLAIDVLFNNKERALSDDQFIKKLNSDELLLSEEIEEWKKKYHLDEGELEKGSAAILKGEIDLTKEGLTERQLNDVKTRIKTLQHLPLPELLDYVRLCTFD